MKQKPLKVLIIKMSSMGDILHTLPALTDAYNNVSQGIEFDWAVEPAFAEIPNWHKAVKNVIEVPIRKWNKAFAPYVFNGEIKNTIKQLRATKYDAVIDAQGLLKSGFLSKFIPAKSYGFDFKSARESFTSFFYNITINVPKDLHAVTRTRLLFAKALNYYSPDFIAKNELDYGINTEKIINTEDNIINSTNIPYPYVVFFHGTTWETKHWPRQYWFELAEIFNENNINVCVTQASDEQKEFVDNLKANSKYSDKIIVLPTLKIFQAAKLIMNSIGVVGVDTGFCHLSAALDKKTVALYGPTSHIKTGTLGKKQIHLASTYDCAPCFLKKCKLIPKDDNNIYPPCFKEISPAQVFEEFKIN